MKSVILVTGASTGIGHLSAGALAAAGHTVYASMRDIDGRNAARVRELRDWSFAQGYDLRAVELDALSQASVDQAVQTVVREQGRLDVVVHNAGRLVVGPRADQLPDAQEEEQPRMAIEMSEARPPSWAHWVSRRTKNERISSRAAIVGWPASSTRCTVTTL